MGLQKTTETIDETQSNKNEAILKIQYRDTEKQKISYLIDMSDDKEPGEMRVLVAKRDGFFFQRTR